LEYAIFISDTHIGSKVFKKDEFLRFIDWINLKFPDKKQKEIASKVKYLFIVGDVVEGVGIFPSQEADVEIKDIYLQYEEAYKYLSLIRKDICIIITPGNHDPMRIAEPQPMHYKDYAKKLYELENVIFLSSPSLVSIAKKDNFEGIDVLLYHGFSIPYYADSVPSIRKSGGLNRSDLVMKYFLERRHLAPTHKSNQFIPDTDYDHLVISRVPDIFATGHIHKVSVLNYKNVSCINCSCWLGATDYQLKLGIYPQPCRALLVNLQSRAVNILKFGQDDSEKEAT
jgi:DNA polymerase II small subunit